MKEPFARILTEAGRQIDVNDEQSQSAYVPIRVSLDPDANVNEQSTVQ
jgi:hypothetical protein